MFRAHKHREPGKDVSREGCDQIGNLMHYCGCYRGWIEGKRKDEKEWEAIADVQMGEALWDSHSHGNIEGAAGFEGREEITNYFQTRWV